MYYHGVYSDVRYNRKIKNRNLEPIDSFHAEAIVAQQQELQGSTKNYRTHTGDYTERICRCLIPAANPIVTSQWQKLICSFRIVLSRTKMILTVFAYLFRCCQRSFIFNNLIISIILNILVVLSLLQRFSNWWTRHWFYKSNSPIGKKDIIRTVSCWTSKGVISRRFPWSYTLSDHLLYAFPAQLIFFFCKWMMVHCRHRTSGPILFKKIWNP